MNNVMHHVNRVATSRFFVRSIAMGVASGALLVVPDGASGATEQAGTYSAPLQTAIPDLPVGTEVRAGYERV